MKRVLPGCKYIQYWYDRENRLVFMQDESLRTSGKYRFFTYDSLGRPVVQGVCEDCDRSISHKVAEMYFTRNAADFHGTGYTWRQHCSIDISGITLEKAIYYDDYDFSSVFPDGYIGCASEKDKAYGAGRMVGTIVRTSVGQYTYGANFYDAKGNLTRTWNKGLDGRSYTMTCTYTLNGSAKRTELCANVNYGDDFLATFNYGYNKLNGKLSKTEISIEHGGPKAMTQMEIKYDDLDRVLCIARPQGVGDVTCGYDIHGWLRSIESKTFKESLYYADGCGKPCYNGNISSMTWQNYGYPQLRGYKFFYDGLDRLTYGEYGEREGLGDKQNRYDERMEYDLNGNIRRLQRRGLKQDGIYGKIDNLHVYLNGNHIDYVEDDAEKIVYSGSFDFNTAGNGRSEYSYDGNGNLLSDTGRGISKIEYDECGNPKRIQFSNGNVIKYVYTADCEKLRTVYLTAMPNLTVPAGETHELSANETLDRDTLEYMLGGSLTLNNGRIDKFLFDGGYFKSVRSTENCTVKPPYPSGKDGNPPTNEQIEQYENAMAEWVRYNSCDLFSVYFYNRDHLGNNRETLDVDGNVVQVTNYYPFGAPFCDEVSSKGIGVQQYKYNGKELDMTHGLNTYDYGARQYYAPLATWDRMDKMAEEYYWMTPYAYCLNNPVRLIDPDGSTVTIVYQQFGTEHVYIVTGKWDEILHAPRNQFVHDVISAHSYLKSHGASEMFEKMIASNKNVYIRQTNGISYPNYDNNRSADLFWDPYSGLEVGNNKYQSPATQLEHEFTHIVNNYKSARDRRIRSETIDEQYENKEERLVIIGHEKEITKKLGESCRYNHKGELYRTKGPTSIEEYKPENKTKDITNHVDYDKVINNSLNNKTDNLRVTRIW